MHRRDFVAGLAGMSGLAAFGTLSAGTTTHAGAKRKGWFARHGLPIGIQLYTLGDELTNDFDGVLKQLGQMGYKRVELAGFYNRTGAQLRQALDAAGLECRSAHVPTIGLGPGHNLSGNLDALIADAKVIGLTDIVVPMIVPAAGAEAFKGPDGFAGAMRTLAPSDYEAMAAVLNDKGRELKAHGLSIAYHNHNMEFAPLPGGSTGYEVLLSKTDPEIVHFEMDVGWVAAAGLDPAALLKTHPGRFKLLHVKDIGASTQSNFALKLDPTNDGAGRQDWKSVLPAAYAAGVRQYFLEQEPPFKSTRVEAARAGHDFLAAFNA